MTNANVSRLSIADLEAVAGGVDSFEACATGAAIGAAIGAAAGAPGGATIALGGLIGAVGGCGVGLITKAWLETSDKR